MKIKMFFLALAALAMLCSSALAGPDLQFPLQCEYGQNCFIQQYFDHDPSPGWKDYTCGSLSYDGHTGTDFRVSYDDYLAGVPVLASADGVVVAIRDNMPDIDAHGREHLIKGKEAGNGVVLEHGDGYRTQYSHLKRGSILVKRGDKVKAGQPLGMVGLSGMTEFPHLELAVRHNGKSVGPFTGGKANPACNDTSGNLWAPETARLLRYIPTAPLDAGFAMQRPSLPEVLRDPLYDAPLQANAPALVFWVAIFGAQQGDVAHLELHGPDGNTLAQNDTIFPKNQAQRLDFIGKKGRTTWPSGEYTGRYTLKRGAQVILDLERRAVIP
ncbi:MAG: M23 family metallopeptidase [Desulfovibrionaceae bacterium]